MNVSSASFNNMSVSSASLNNMSVRSASLHTLTQTHILAIRPPVVCLYLHVIVLFLFFTALFVSGVQ
jgi:hypothetical protein